MGVKHGYKITPVILVLSLIVQFSGQVSVNEFLTITGDQKATLDKFRQLVSDRLPHEYMKSDAELVRWLRDADFDIPTAERRLMDNLAWREENRMDSILDEDWDDFEEEYRITIEGCDKEGKLVISVRVGDWNLRNAIVRGQSERMARFFDKLFEEANVMVLKMREANMTMTQPTMIFDMSSFNMVEQGCLRCIPIYFHMLTTCLNNYPGVVHKIVAVNSPQIAIPLWNVVKNALPPKTRDLLYIYGRDKTEWKQALLEEIDQDQLTIEYGGNKKEGIDLLDYKRGGTLYKCTNI